MKSFIMSMFLLTNAFGAALGAAISPAAKDPNLTWMYTGLAVGSFIAGLIFWVLYSRYNATEDSMNDLERHGDKRLPLVPTLPLTYKVSRFDLNSLVKAGEGNANGGNTMSQGV